MSGSAHNRESHDNAAESPGFRVWLRKMINEPVALFTLLLVIFTALLWYSTDGLWREARSSSEVAKQAADAATKAADAASKNIEEFSLSERAWMSLVRMEGNPFQNAHDATGNNVGNGFIFTAQWINSGNTPARDVVMLCKSQETDLTGQYNDLDKFGLNAKPEGVITPHTTVSCPMIVFDKSINALIARKARLFIYIRVNYKDIYHPSIARYTDTLIEVKYGGMQGNQLRFLFPTIKGDAI